MCCRTKLFKRDTPYKLTGKLVAGGRLIPKKGLDRLKGVENLTVFGDGPLMKDLSGFILHKSTFTGNLNGRELKDLFEQSSIYLFPAIVTPDGDSDGIPNTIKEAMLMELQVIAAPVAGIPELKHIMTLENWSQHCLEKCIGLTPKEPNKKGRQEILDIYSPEKCVDRIEKIMEKYG